jgi:hypothetical protein
MDWIIRDAVEIALHLNNISREDGFSLCMSWKPLIHDLREQKQAPNKNMMPSSGDPEKGRFFSYSTSYPASPFPPHNLPEGSLLVRIFSP